MDNSVPVAFPDHYQFELAVACPVAALGSPHSTFNSNATCDAGVNVTFWPLR